MNSAILVPRGSTITIRSRRLSRIMVARASPGGLTAQVSYWLLTTSTGTAIAPGSASNSVSPPNLHERGTVLGAVKAKPRGWPPAWRSTGLAVRISSHATRTPSHVKPAFATRGLGFGPGADYQGLPGQCEASHGQRRRSPAALLGAG